MPDANAQPDARPDAKPTAPAPPVVPKINIANLAAVPKMDHARIAEYCRDRPDEAAAMLIALFREKTAEMPDTVFVKRDGAFLKRVRADVRLTEAERHLAPAKKIDGHTVEWDLTADGYRKLNGYVGLMVLSPAVTDGRPNPWVETDRGERDGVPINVHCRKVCIGPSPTSGALVATDVSVRYSLQLYYLEALQAKMRDGRNAIRVGDEDDVLDQRVGERWKFLPITMGMGLWINVWSPEVAECLKQHTGRLKFCERIAQTIAERNAMRAHPAMPSSVKAVEGVAMVRVHSWTTTSTAQDVERFQKMLERAEGLNGIMDVTARVIDVDEAATDVAVDEVVQDEQTAEGVVADTQAPAPEAKTPHRDLTVAAVEACVKLNEIHGSRAVRAKLEQEFGIPGAAMTNATPEQMQRVVEWSRDGSPGTEAER